MKLLLLVTAWLLSSPLLSAQLVVSVPPVKVIGQKAVVKLGLKNELTEPIESARAVVFLLDAQGKMIAQTAQWVIGGGPKDRPPLESKKESTYNVVLTASNLTSTNLTAKVQINRLLFKDGKSADLNQSVRVQVVADDATKEKR
jgi:hypothetical protein